MAEKQKRKRFTIPEALDEIQNRSDVEVTDSSDSSNAEYDEEEDTFFLLSRDPVYDQEDDQLDETSGPSGTSSTAAPQPSSPPAEATSPLSSEDDEDEEFVPPARKTRRSSASSRYMTRRSQGASASTTRVSPSPAPAPSQSKRGQQRRRGPAGKRPKQAISGRGDGDDDQEWWCNPEEPDVEPPLPKFEPKHPSGPRIDRTAAWSPLSLFKLFFSSSTIHTILNNTNDNAARRKASGMHFKWSPFTVENFYIFLAVILYSGMVHVHSRSDMWRREWPYDFTFPRSCMTRDTFEAIFWSLHLCDIKEDEENQKKKGTPEYDRLFKIKPLYSQIVTACNSLFQPCREISIDERMVASKARIGFRQYMRDKPTKFGYKLFVLAESCSGYTWNFFVYQGKTANVQGEGLSFTSVMDLMNFALLGKGYHLYVDNFYTSPALFQQLATNCTAACGTIRQTHIGFPKTKLNELPKKAERGDMRWLRKDNLLFVKWKDTTEVTVCSSFHKAYSGDSTRRRVKEDGQWHNKNIPVPDAIRDYNRYMGGVDLSDAMIQYYSVRGKTMRWYKTFFYHFVDIAVVNSYILFKLLAIGRGETPMSHKRFREVLMKEMVDKAQAAVAAAAPRPTLSTTCMPMYFGQTATDQRRVCVVCKDQGRKWIVSLKPQPAQPPSLLRSSGGNERRSNF
uniref:PiggyBac transposable element-derived protein domain-containing protein n=1 Tax=Dicentrarchus labrax TaxID=13489 RepID=A0A8C4IJE8_DICLA